MGAWNQRTSSMTTLESRFENRGSRIENEGSTIMIRGCHLSACEKSFWMNAMKRAENQSWSTWQCHAAAPHTEPINTKGISSKMPYQAAITQRCPTRNQNQGTACTAPSTCTLYCACQPGRRCHRGVQYTSSCKWSSQHHCTRSSPHSTHWVHATGCPGPLR